MFCRDGGKIDEVVSGVFDGAEVAKMGEPLLLVVSGLLFSQLRDLLCVSGVASIVSDDDLVSLFVVVVIKGCVAFHVGVVVFGMEDTTFVGLVDGMLSLRVASLSNARA